MSITLMNHQSVMRDDWSTKTNINFDTSDPGTGKTIGTLAGFDAVVMPKKRLLILAPLSILKAAWANDVEKYGHYKVGIAHGTPDKRRAVMLDRTLDIVVTNHDAVKWIAKDDKLSDGFTHLCLDESTAFKNAQTQRWKALASFVRKFRFVKNLTGTPNPNTVMDLWAQAFLLDGGERLGTSFFKFRSICCEPTQVGPDPKMVKWNDKPGALDYAMDKLKDITTRFKMEDCIDIPEHRTREMFLDMPPFIAKAYAELEARASLDLASGKVTAVHAGILVKKLLQLLSGAVYDEDGKPLKLHTERYELILQLVSERQATLVGYNWGHELDAMTALADKMGIKYGVINGNASPKRRSEVVDEFQAGRLQVVFAHPAAAAHGLTLTRGTATIWASPTYSSEHYQQFNRRIYRNGQTQKTETIRIGYNDSREIDVYDKLDGKLENMSALLSLFTQNTSMRKAS